MAGQLSTDDTRFTRRARPQSVGCDGGLRHSDLCTILPRSHSVRSRVVSSPPKTSEVRPISVLAELLSPFAGAEADCHAPILLRQFGTIDRMLAASDRQILEACGHLNEVGVMIVGARALVLASLQEAVTRTKVDPDDANFTNYLSLKLGGRPHEELHAIFVDHAGGFIAEELISIGGTGRVDAKVSVIIRRSIELAASGFYLVHNHPSKCPNPSPDDVRATRQISSVARALEIDLIDHFVIAGRRVVSMRGLDLL